MNNAALAGAALPTMNDTVDVTQIVTSPAARPARENTPELRAYQQAPVDDDADFDLAVLVVARRFALTFDHAKVVASLAGLGVTGD